jgi:hypothetical protein
LITAGRSVRCAAADIASGNIALVKQIVCVLKALPEAVAAKTAFLVDHFVELASTLVSEGSIETVTNQDVRTFLRRVGGDISVR